MKKKLEIFIGKNADYYLKRFEKFEKGSSISWNWSAFGFGIFWMAYRKMYLFTFLAILLTFILNYIESSVNFSPLFSLLLSLWLWLGFGMFGNYLYYIHAKNKVAQITLEFPDEKEQQYILEKEGGTSWSSVFFFILIFIIVSGISQYLIEKNRF